jgi:radical SAM superfamily enzyme YgiQ (UPF0313 family)
MITSQGEVHKERGSVRILLIRPPFFNVEGSRGDAMDIPLGLLSIASVLEREGHAVSIFDARVQSGDIFRRQPFMGGFLQGASWEEIATAVRNAAPDIVGISCPFTTQFSTAVKTAELVKQIDREIVTAVGGPHASVLPESFFMQSNSVDIAVIGEGEYAMAEIATWYRNEKPLEHIGGIVYRRDDAVIATEKRNFIGKLDELPLPAYHLVDMERYFTLKQTGSPDVARPRYNYEGSERSISFITSRGCPFNCVFCSIHLHMGQQWRAHSPEYVLRHLEYIIKHYGVRHIHFEDDNLTLRNERFERILDGIRARKLKLTWDTPNGVRADTLNRDLLTKCKETGCVYLIIGIESGDQEVLDKVIRKKLSLDKVVKAIGVAHDVGLDMRAFYVIGFPGESREQMQKTLDFALELQRKYGVWPNVHIANPLIGTSLHKICVERAYIEGNQEGGSSPDAFARISGVIETENFTPDDVRELREKFARRATVNHYRSFVMGLCREPGLALYILTRALREPGRFKEFCADTVFFRHFLIKGLTSPERSSKTAKKVSPVIADA